MGDNSGQIDLPAEKGVFSRELGTELLSALMDVRFQTSVANKMLPIIYMVLIVGLVAINVSVVAEAFGRNVWQGLFHLLIIAPAYLVAGVVIIRVSLELVVSIFRIAAHVEELSGWSRDFLGLEGLRDALKSKLPKRSSSES